MCDVLAKLLLFMVDDDVFAGVPDSCQESAMVELNYFVDELFSDVGHRAQMQRHHSCHLVLKDLHKVHPSVGADNDLVAQACRLDLVNVPDCLEPLADVKAERADRNHIDEAIILTADDLVFIDLGQGSHARLRSYVLDALEVLLDIKNLDLILPSAHEDELLCQEQAFGQV